jgi:hypothetical protein
VRRWAFHIFCAVSLLVFAGSIVLWVRSCFVSEGIARREVHSGWVDDVMAGRSLIYAAGSAGGCIGFYRYRSEFNTILPGRSGWEYKKWPPIDYAPAPASPSDRINVHFGGFQWVHSIHVDRYGWTSHQSLTLPLWIFLPAAIPPILWWRRYRRKDKRGFPVEATSPAPVS